MRAIITAVVAGLAGCSDPTFDVHIDVHPLLAALEDDVVPGNDPIYSVRVIDAEAAGGDCTDVAFGYLDRDVIAGATRTSVTAGRGASLTGVPRLGPKLVIVEARARNGRLYGGGCESRGDITADERVEVYVHVSPAVQVLSRADTPLPMPVTVQLTTPWDETIVVPDHPVRTDLYTMDADPITDDREHPSDPMGVVVTPMLPSPGAPPPARGPVQTVVRVAWASELVRVPGFVAWGTVPTRTGAPIALGPPLPGVRRAWALVPQVPDGRRYLAATLQTGAGGGEELVALFLDDDNRLDLQSAPAAGARAVAMFARPITLLDDGWHALLPPPMGLQRMPWPSVGRGAAAAIHPVRSCRDDVGLLVHRQHDTLPTMVWTAYRVEGNTLALDPPGGELAELAAVIQPGDESVIGAGCLTLDNSALASNVGVVVTGAPDQTLRAHIVGINAPDPAVAPEVRAVTSFRVDTRWLAAAAEIAMDGPRVASYKLAEVAVPSGGTRINFVSVPLVASELATLPSSFEVADLEGDGAYDVVAAIPTINGPRLQVNLGKDINGEPLASLGPLVPGGTRANDAVVRFIDIDRSLPGGAGELVVVSDAGAEVYCLPAGISTCDVD